VYFKKQEGYFWLVHCEQPRNLNFFSSNKKIQTTTTKQWYVVVTPVFYQLNNNC